jgi:ribosome-binding factor A
MRSHRRMRGHHAPPFVDPAFAEGLSPRRDRQSSSKPDYKTQQLCRQAQRVLGLSLGELRDEVLGDLMIESVAPFPDASRLVVRVIVPQHAQATIPEVIEHLARAHGALRHALAQAITRKRAPDLVFVPLRDSEVRP